MEDDIYRALYAELEAYEHMGVRMGIDDHPASPMQIVKAHMIREDASYMRDYVMDDDGKLRELLFYNVADN